MAKPLTYHKAYRRDEAGNGPLVHEETWAGRWLIFEEADGSCGIKDYAEEEWVEGEFATLDEAKAKVQELYEAELRSVGL